MATDWSPMARVLRPKAVPSLISTFWKEKNPSVIFRGEDNSYYEKFTRSGEVKCIDEEIPFEIPNGWVWARMGQIGDWGAGSTPSRSNPNYYNGKILWLKTGELNNGQE